MRCVTALPYAGVAALAGAVLFAGWTWMAGQDASWDLQNYHDYAAYALLHWRYPLDVGMGGFQGYFNPLPYLVPYGLRHSLPPLAAGLLIADLQPSVLVLDGFLLLLQADTEDAGNVPQARWRLVLAGAFVGAAAGLKLTNGGWRWAWWPAPYFHSDAHSRPAAAAWSWSAWL